MTAALDDPTSATTVRRPDADTDPAGVRAEVTRRTFEIIARKAEIDPASVDADTPIEALGIDSLGMAELAFEIEDAFDIEIPDTAAVADRFLQLSTAGGAVDLVLGQMADRLEAT